MHAPVLLCVEHNVATVSAARIAMMPRARMEELVVSSPALTRAVLWSQLVDEDTLRAWIANLSRRNSVKRISHLRCELHVRARSVG